MRRHVPRWGVGLLGALALLGLGLLYTDRTLLTAALIPLAYVLYGTLSRVPADTQLSIERTIQPTAPEPGEPVDVTLRVRNEGASVFPDLRVIDGVPAELVVTEGSPRLCVPLSPGESVETSYTAVAKRGEFTFDEPAVRIRSLAGANRETRTVSPDGDTSITCTNIPGDPPVGENAIRRQGSLPVDEGGTGLEFYSTRQYKRGDPVNRIDWHHVAKTGEFITIEYRKEQAVRTAVVVDARGPTRLTPKAGYPTGMQLCAYAGERLFESLSDAGVVTSATALGFQPGDLDGLVGPDGLPWIDPQHDRAKGGRAQLLFERLQTLEPTTVGHISLEMPSLGSQAQTTAPAPGPGETPRPQSADARADGGDGLFGVSGDTRSGEPSAPGISRLLARLPEDTQVLLCTPLTDNWPVRLVRALTMRSYPVVVVSPDVLTADTPGQRLGAVARQTRLRALDRMGADTVDWPVTEPIAYAVRNSLPHMIQ